MTVEERTRRAEQGTRVRMARHAIPLSQGQLAVAVSDITGDPISRTIISDIEAGKRDAEVGILRAIAKTCRVSWEWLSGDRDIPGYLNPWYGTELDTPEPGVSLNQLRFEALVAAS